jgi:hypothetical protein
VQDLENIAKWVRFGTALVAILVGWWIGGVDTLAFVLKRPEWSVSSQIHEWYGDKPTTILLALILVWHLFIQK